jgi:hypothetical protein
MAMIGSMIALMFALSLVVAPPLYGAIGMAGLFALTGVLALAAIWVVHALVPDVAAAPRAAAAPGRSRWRAALDPELLRLNLGILVLHVVLYAVFIVLPLQLVAAGLELAGHWKLYLPVVLASFLIMLPPILYADRRNRPKPILLGAVALLLAVEAALGAVPTGVVGIALALLAFFAAFNELEALLPALVSRLAPAEERGFACGRRRAWGWPRQSIRRSTRRGARRCIFIQ